MKRDGDVMIRHGEVPDVGTFDARATLSADGNTFTDVETEEVKGWQDVNGHHRIPSGRRRKTRQQVIRSADQRRGMSCASLSRAVFAAV